MGNTNLTTYTYIKQKLMQKINESDFEDNRLPSEVKLAKELEISLATLREALIMLALEGYITKRHGSGNFVHPSAFNPRDRIDLGITFEDSFRHQGKEPGMEIVSIKESLAGSSYAEMFIVDERDIIASCEVIYKADDMPSIYTIQNIPKKILKRPFELGCGNENFYDFLKELNVTHSLNEYKSVALPDKISKIFELSHGTPILYCSQMYYNIKDKPVLHNEHYFHPNRFGIKVVQNWDVSAI